MRPWLKPSTFKHPQKVADYSGWSFPGIVVAIATEHGLQLHLCQWIKKLLFYWCLYYITVCLPSPRRSYPMVFMHTVQCSHFLIERHSVWNSLQFFQWLVMLQCCGQSYGSSVSQLIESEAVVRYKHTTTNKFNVSVAMAMIAPHHQSSHWYCFILHMPIGIVVAIATEHVCHITSIQKPHSPAVTVLTIEHNLIDFKGRACNLKLDFLQDSGRWCR